MKREFIFNSFLTSNQSLSKKKSRMSNNAESSQISNSMLNSIWKSDDTLRLFKNLMENEPLDLPFVKNLFTVEKISEGKTLTINVVVNARAQVNLVQLTAAQIETLTTNKRQTKITNYFTKKSTLKELVQESTSQAPQELNNENLPVNFTNSTSIDYPTASNNSFIQNVSRNGNFAKKRTNPVITPAQKKEYIQFTHDESQNFVSRKRSREDSDYGTSSNKSFKLESKDDDTSNNCRNSRSKSKNIVETKLEMISPPVIIVCQPEVLPTISELPATSQIVDVVSYCVKDDLILFEVKWKKDFISQNSWKPIEYFKGCSKFADFMNKLYNSKLGLLEHLYYKIINMTPDIELAFEGQHKKILKALETFDLNEFKRSMLLTLIMNDKKSEPKADLRQLCYLKYFYDKKNQRDMINNTILAKIKAQNPRVRIEFENMVDFDPLVEDFTYISKNIITSGIIIPNTPVSKCCSCEDNCSSKQKCCATRKKSRLSYSTKKRLKRLGNSHLPIFECNQSCKCGPNCVNRVVQLGSRIPLCLFKTSDGKDLGLKTRAPIHRGQFISEYVGEIIDNVNAEKRGKQYLRAGTHYVFNMDFYHSKKPYSIDGTNFGNATRFINHSCQPNCSVYSVWYNSIDNNFPKLAFFALRNINKNEELTIDYSGGPSEQTTPEKNIFLKKCKCGATKCRKIVYT